MHYYNDLSIFAFVVGVVVASSSSSFHSLRQATAFQPQMTPPRIIGRSSSSSSRIGTSTKSALLWSFPCRNKQHHMLKLEKSIFPRTISLALSSSFVDEDSSHEPSSASSCSSVLSTRQESIWEQIAGQWVNIEADPSKMPEYVQLTSLLRVGVPSFLAAAVSKWIYPFLAMTVAGWIVSGDHGGDTAGSNGVFLVVSQDSSQYIQNILTTSGLVFSLLVGQTYYFMVRRLDLVATGLDNFFSRPWSFFLTKHNHNIYFHTFSAVSTARKNLFGIV